ncbi:L,D-transpeptidase [Streptomyces sp. LZ34]
MPRSSTGTVVAALTAAALGGVGFLAYQASATAERPSHSRHDSQAGDSKSKPKGKGKDGDKKSTALPGDSGTGLRVVYALKDRRVWLVGADEQPTRTFEVSPSSASPTPGTYEVTSRIPSTIGSDGVQVEHVVVFDTEDGVVFGFSAAVDGSAPDPSAAKKTGGVRESRADATAMWEFAQAGTRVVVIA